MTKIERTQCDGCGEDITTLDDQLRRLTLTEPAFSFPTRVHSHAVKTDFHNLDCLQKYVEKSQQRRLDAIRKRAEFDAERAKTRKP